MPTSRRSTASTFAGFAIAALLLTGCSTGGGSLTPVDEPEATKTPSASAPAAGSQSREEACTILTEGVQETSAEMQASMTDPSADPVAAAEAITKLSDVFAETAATIENAEVRAVADTASASLVTFSEQLSAFAANPAGSDQAALSTAGTEFEASMSALGETCP